MHGFSKKWFKNKFKQVHKIRLKIDKKFVKKNTVKALLNE